MSFGNMEKTRLVMLLLILINYQLKLQPDTSEKKYVTADSTTGTKYIKKGVFNNLTISMWPILSKNMRRGERKLIWQTDFLERPNTQPYLGEVWKCSDWLARCPLQLPRGTPNTQPSLRKQECEEKREKPQPIFLWPSDAASLCALSLSRSALSPFFIKKKHM